MSNNISSPIEAVITDEGKVFVSLDDIIRHGEISYDLACERTNEEARLAASYNEGWRKLKREWEAELAAQEEYHSLIEDGLSDAEARGTAWAPLGEADPELERLIAEEEEIERRTRGDGDYKTWRHANGVPCNHREPYDNGRVVDAGRGDYYGLASERRY